MVAATAAAAKLRLLQQKWADAGGQGQWRLVAGTLCSEMHCYPALLPFNGRAQGTPVTMGMTAGVDAVGARLAFRWGGA